MRIGTVHAFAAAAGAFRPWVLKWGPRAGQPIVSAAWRTCVFGLHHLREVDHG